MIKRILKLILCLIAVIISFSYSNADSSFREHRFDSFRVLPEAKEGDIIFIGNSITNMMEWHEAFGNNENIKERGVSGAYTWEILSNLESLVKGSPSKIFLMIGTNDLALEGEMNEPESVAYRIKEILIRTRTLLPETEIYYQSILPSLKGLRTKEKTETVNTLIEKWINDKGDENIIYVDLYTPFLGENGNLKNSSSSNSSSSYSYDGLHLTQKGYKIWLDILKDYLGDNIINENTPNLWGKLKGSQGMRVSYFGSLPTFSSDVLLIGDEMIHGGEWHELLNYNFKDRGTGWGFPGISLSEIEGSFEDILFGNAHNGVTREAPLNVIFYAGMNDLSKKDSFEETKSLYHSVVDSLKNKLPESTIWLMTLLPINDKEKEINERIKSLNESIKLLAEEEERIKVIDLYDSFTNKEGGRLNKLFMDFSSPYLNGMGYVKVAQEIYNHINGSVTLNSHPLEIENANTNTEVGKKLRSKDSNFEIVFENAISEIPYRIPAIAHTKNNDIIAVTDYRYSKADIGMVKNGKLDLKYRIKPSNKSDWGPINDLAVAEGEGDENIAFGDPCIVANCESNKILVTSCMGNVSFPKGTHDNHQGWARFVSEDGGKTWTDCEDISDQIFNQLDKRDDGPIRCFFIGSGKITQSKIIKTGDFYRLYCAALVKINNGKNVNYVFYSDDFGKKWNILGEVNDCPIPEGGDEPKAEELPDGNVLISSRTSGGRLFNVFHYEDFETGKGAWDEMVKSSKENRGVMASSNACNGEVLLLPVSDKTNKDAFILLQSVPLNQNGKRANVGINYKILQTPEDYSSSLKLAENWNGFYEVTPYSSAYSTMTNDKDGNILFLYEENESNGGYDIIYKKISIDEITNGKYRPMILE